MKASTVAYLAGSLAAPGSQREVKEPVRIVLGEVGVPIATRRGSAAQMEN